MESGEGDYGPNSTVCFGYNFHAGDVMHIVAVADVLQCSVDYLLGRTEDRQSHLSYAVEQNPVSDSGTFWQTGYPETQSDYLLMLKDDGCDTQYELWHWKNDEWVDDWGPYNPNIDGEILGWIPMPKLPEKPKPASNESCITGMSPSGHCGAAACNARRIATCAAALSVM